MAVALNISDWLKALPIPWLVGNEHGQADATAQGAVYDDQVATLKLAAKASMPTVAPVDALDNIGNDRLQIQGPVESSADFAVRLQKAWNLWQLAGSAAPLLIALWYQGFQDAVIVQQNGTWWKLDGHPDLDDPLATLTQGDLGAAPTSIPGPGGRNAGDPWWTFDTRYDWCSRFAVLLPTGWPACSARLVFDGSTDTVTGDWTRPFDAGSSISVSETVVVTSGGPVVVTITAAAGTVTATASAPFVGYVDVLGWVTGNDPFLDPRANELGNLRKIINTWRPAKATCVEIICWFGGVVWGWPARTWGDGLLWGAPTDYSVITP